MATVISTFLYTSGGVISMTSERNGTPFLQMAASGLLAQTISGKDEEGAEDSPKVCLEIINTGSNRPKHFLNFIAPKSISLNNDDSPSAEEFMAWHAAAVASGSGGGGMPGTVLVNQSPYNATEADELILVDASAGTVVINLPTITGKKFNVKKIDASANSVQVQTPGGTTEATAHYSIAAKNEAAIFQCDGENYFIISSR
jgi:hypothetical protein